MPDYEDWEFMIMTDEEKVCQKKLNQWRHEYWLEILYAFPTNVHREITIILVRKRK